MKTIVAVIFLGIFTYAFGGIPRIKECKKLTALHTLDSTKFFSGVWYMTNVMNGLSSTVCQELKPKKKGPKLSIDYNYKRNGNKFEVSCESKGEEKNGQIPFKCEIDKSGFSNILKRDEKFQANFTIITTDYTDYALFYRCVMSESGVKADNYVVLRRNKSDYNIPQRAQTWLQIYRVQMKKCDMLPTEDDINSEIV